MILRSKERLVCGTVARLHREIFTAVPYARHQWTSLMKAVQMNKCWKLKIAHAMQKMQSAGKQKLPKSDEGHLKFKQGQDKLVTPEQKHCSTT